AYALAHRIVVVSARFRPGLAERGVPDARVVEIPDWVDLERIRPAEAEPEVRARLGGATGDLLVLHAGSMGAKQALGTAVEAAGVASCAGPVRLALVGEGPERPALEALAAGVPGRPVRLLPLQPDGVFRLMLAAADVLLLTQRADVRD